METNVTKAVVKKLVISESVSESVHVECESVTDFENMSVDEILSSGGVRKYVFFLKNCADKLETLKTALQNKETYVCVYTAQVSEVTDGSIIRVIDDGQEVAKYTALTYVVPCKKDFVPTETNINAALIALKGQIERRIADGKYEVEQDDEKDRCNDLSFLSQLVSHLPFVQRQFYINIQPFNRIIHKSHTNLRSELYILID